MKSLFSRLWLSVTFAVLLLLATLWQWLEYSQQYTQQRVQQSLHSELAEHMADINPMLASGVTADSALKEAFHDLMLLGPSFEIYTLDTAGKVIAYDAKEEKIQTQTVNLLKINDFLNKERLPILGTDPRGINHEKIFSVAKLIDPEGKHTGFLYVIIGGEQLDSWQTIVNENQAPTKFGVAIFFSILSAITIFTLFLKYFTKPLARLATDLSNIDVSNLTNGLALPIRYRGSREVNQLSRDINILLEKLSDQHQALTKIQKSKHDFLLHLSHDLKTPLTSLLGYQETWLHTPESERESKWIEVAYRSGEKLKQLLTQLLELAALENGKITPSLETVSLNALLSDLEQSFAPQAKTRKVKLAFKQTSDSIISTDVGLMRRILSNLIDNAIRHTPSGGLIDITLEKSARGSILKVRDTGAGMHIHELKAFNENKAESFSKESALPQLGVGLSIVQQLAALLNYKIDITSQPGKGCCFSLYI
ncbi:sensor histidine kinase [Parashewanella spongiae]|uniref:histidine kinase n=1 Tax=Parashewanella spongiae TaxID=342950 RepID=A0A3A6TY20_9GAMM|nr:HAMP domain-containing sensor histidine kinase [Parashewanella spongiae]MCL1078689.1 HAMP domain-containing histidine kinase [Parashewanella spongiae]RJY19402.1 sensor histidine kinase [Parashewanella spongiae]